MGSTWTLLLSFGLHILQLQWILSPSSEGQHIVEPIHLGTMEEDQEGTTIKQLLGHW